MLRVHLASDTLPIQIDISSELPDTQTLQEAEVLYKEDAQKVFEALHRLPQGTRYQLTILLLQATPNLYRRS